MKPLVSGEVCSLPKSHPAFLTCVGFLASVDSTVESKLLADSKGLPTFFTLIGLLHKMDSLTWSSRRTLLVGGHFFRCDFHLSEIALLRSLLAFTFPLRLPFIF